MELTKEYFEKHLDQKLDEKLDQKLEKLEERLFEKLDQKLDEKLDQKLDEKLKNFATKDDLASGLNSLEQRLESHIHDAVDQLAVIIDRSVAQPMERHFASIKAHQGR